MAKRFICLQAGHQNAAQNCDPNLKKSTGAPGEAEFTVLVRDRVKDLLLSKKNADGSDAFMVQLVDSTFNCDPNADNTDFSLFLALHYDAYVNGSEGGFADYPDPNTDFATKESQRITKVINDIYFPETEIKYVNRSNANTRFYYMWKFLSAKTPCVLLECGTGQNPHDKVILSDTDRAAKAIVRAICKAFDVPYDNVIPVPPTDPCADLRTEFEDYKKKYNQETQDAAVKKAVDDLNSKIDNAQK